MSKFNHTREEIRTFDLSEDVITPTHGLPLISRSIDEILTDCEIQLACEASLKRSQERRTPSKRNLLVTDFVLDFASEFIAEYRNRANEIINLDAIHIAALMKDN